MTILQSIHINNQEVISKYEFGIRLAELLELDSKYIEKGSLHAFENKGNEILISN